MEIKENQLQKEFLFILDEIAPIFAELQPYLRDFDTTEQRIYFLKSSISMIEEQFMGMVRSLRSNEEHISIETAIRIFGVQNSHDLLLASVLMESIEKKEFEWDKTTKRPKRDSSEIFPYTQKVRQIFGTDVRSFYEISLAALTFDVLHWLNIKLGVQPKKTEQLIESQFDGAIRVAQLGLQEGKKLDALKLDQYLIAVILLKRSGRIILSMLNPEYHEFADSIKDNHFRSRFAHLAEQSQYRVSNNLVSALLCKFIPGLEPVHSALLYYDYPFMVSDKENSTDIYDLVSLCADLQIQEA